MSPIESAQSGAILGIYGPGKHHMKQPIVAYHKDDENHWVAELACGHNQHVRHNPPLVSRPWVLTEAGRESMLGYELDCKKCDSNAPVDN